MTPLSLPCDVTPGEMAHTIWRACLTEKGQDGGPPWDQLGPEWREVWRVIGSGVYSLAFVSLHPDPAPIILDIELKHGERRPGPLQ
jgi:hypothetical protein